MTADSRVQEVETAELCRFKRVTLLQEIRRWKYPHPDFGKVSERAYYLVAGSIRVQVTELSTLVAQLARLSGMSFEECVIHNPFVVATAVSNLLRIGGVLNAADPSYPGLDAAIGHSLLPPRFVSGKLQFGVVANDPIEFKTFWDEYEFDSHAINCSRISRTEIH